MNPFASSTQRKSKHKHDAVTAGDSSAPNALVGDAGDASDAGEVPPDAESVVSLSQSLSQSLSHKKRTFGHINDEFKTINNKSVNMQDLPTQVVQYQLLTFCTTNTAIKLTQASHRLFTTLQHKIRRKEVVSRYRFIQQSQLRSTQIGAFSAVHVQTLHKLTSLITHIADFAHVTGRKLNPLLYLEVQFNEPPGKIAFPPTLHTLTFGYWFNQSLNQVTLPPHLHTLAFGYSFNQSLDHVTLPRNLHTLTFGSRFNQTLNKDTLPPTLHTLTFGFWFDQSLDKVTLPPTLHTLTFGYCFNHTLYRITLPPDLHILEFKDLFNQPLDKAILPSTLCTLTFGNDFNQSLADVTFPASLQMLFLGRNFNQSLLGITVPRDLIIQKEGNALAAELLPQGLRIEYADMS